MLKTSLRRMGLIRMLAAALFLVPGATLAAETGPDLAPTPTTTSPTARDIQVILRVRRTLMTDDVLGPQNVGIIVRVGVVTLWGPLTSADEIRQAIKAVKDVRGVQSVRSELYVAKDRRPAPPLWVLPDTPTPDRAAPLEPERQTVLAKRDRLPTRLPGDKDGPTSLPVPHTASLLAPVPLEAGPEEPTTVTAARSEGVPAAIERLQRGDARFSQIGVDWHDGTILLRSNPNDPAAVMTFARALADVPGVERVVLQTPKR